MEEEQAHFFPLEIGGSRDVIPEAAAASLRNLLEMQVAGCHANLLTQKRGGWGPAVCSDGPSGIAEQW